MNLLVLFFSNFIASLSIGLSLVIAPWVLSSIEGGETTLVLTASITTFVLIFISPLVGRIVDSVSRKMVMFFSFLFMSVILVLCSYFYNSVIYQKYTLVTFYFSSQLFFLITYSARNAFIQEVFSSEEHGKVNGWMEFETQIAGLISAIVTIYILGDSVFQSALMLCGIFMVISALLILLIPYKSEHNKSKIENSLFIYKGIFKRKNLIFIGLAANTPFLVVMMLNVINPIYFNQILELEVSSIAIASISYTCGATLFSFYAKKVIDKLGEKRAMFLSISTFSFCALLSSLFPIFNFIVAISFLWGGFNSVSKISFNTYVMSVVDKSVIGSYLSIIQGCIYSLRTILGLILSFYLVYAPTDNYYLFAFFVSLLGVVLYISSREVEKPKLKFAS